MLYLNDIHVNCFVYFENTYFVPVCMDCFHLFLSLSQSLLVIFFSTAHRHRSSRISKHFPWFLKIAILLNISTFLSNPLAFPSSSAYQCLPWSPVFFVSMPKPLQIVKKSPRSSCFSSLSFFRHTELSPSRFSDSSK